MPYTHNPSMLHLTSSQAKELLAVLDKGMDDVCGCAYMVCDTLGQIKNDWMAEASMSVMSYSFNPLWFALPPKL